jgi:hypothetical protein
MLIHGPTIRADLAMLPITWRTGVPLAGAALAADIAAIEEEE